MKTKNKRREALKIERKPDLKRPANFAEAIRRHIEPLGGVELVLPVREPMRKPPKLTK